MGPGHSLCSASEENDRSAPDREACAPRLTEAAEAPVSANNEPEPPPEEVGTPLVLSAGS